MYFVFVNFKMLGNLTLKYIFDCLSLGFGEQILPLPIIDVTSHLNHFNYILYYSDTY